MQLPDPPDLDQLTQLWAADPQDADEVAHLIERGVSPDRILLLTFTRRAAQEMLSRAAKLVGSAHLGAVTHEK